MKWVFLCAAIWIVWIVIIWATTSLAGRADDRWLDEDRWLHEPQWNEESQTSPIQVDNSRDG